MTPSAPNSRPVGLVTGVGRAAGIGAAVALRLAEDGWDVATGHWEPYDERVHPGTPAGEVERIGAALRTAGARTLAIAADLADPGAPARLFDAAEAELGAVSALVLCHCESVDSSLLETSVESFDRHLAVNARAPWLLICEFARRFPGARAGGGRIVALTSDDTVGNLPYGASKAALDRIVIAAAAELAGRGITANVVNPGPVDTGWIDAALRESLITATPLGRVGRPADAAALVGFLCSADGGWINGQLLHSDGGLVSRPPA